MTWHFSLSITVSMSPAGGWRRANARNKKEQVSQLDIATFAFFLANCNTVIPIISKNTLLFHVMKTAFHLIAHWGYTQRKFDVNMCKELLSDSWFRSLWFTAVDGRPSYPKIPAMPCLHCYVGCRDYLKDPKMNIQNMPVLVMSFPNSMG